MVAEEIDGTTPLDLRNLFLLSAQRPLPLPPSLCARPTSKPNLTQVAELTEILQKRLGVSTMSFAAPMGGGGGFGGGSPAAGGAPAAAAAAPAEEKTEFDVKLDAVDGDARLKVIKEVRAATGLGLKEAKEVVERAPTVIKAGMKKEEAAELKAKLEAAGAKVSLE